MKVIKKINNNTAICIDNNNHELIAIGKGIGFKSVPYEIEDLSIIDRTFYDVESKHINLLNELSEEVILTATEIVDLVRMNLSIPINSNLIFSLADHINYAVTRAEKGIVLDTPLYYDIQHLHRKEFDMGLEGLAIIKNRMKIRLPKEEASNLALHFLNVQNITESKKEFDYSKEIIEEITTIIAADFQIYIDKTSFNYSRFATHLQYLLKRQEYGLNISDGNKKIFDSLKKEYPQTKECVLKIASYLDEQMELKLNDDELLYLMLHVNRLCFREDCHHTGA